MIYVDDFFMKLEIKKKKIDNDLLIIFCFDRVLEFLVKISI